MGKKAASPGHRSEPQKPVTGRTLGGGATGAWGGRSTQRPLTRATVLHPRAPSASGPVVGTPSSDLGPNPTVLTFLAFPGWRLQDPRSRSWPHTAPGFSHASCRDHQPQIQSSAEHHHVRSVEKQAPQEGKGLAQKHHHREPSDSSPGCSSSAHLRVLGNRARRPPHASLHEGCHWGHTKHLLLFGWG